MTLERYIAAAFRLDEEVWRRHANPWSVWTRFTALPLLIVAVWSRAWLGWWALVPVGAALAWIWVNPRVFPPPASFDSWASKGVFGERLWMNRDNVAVPVHHKIVPNVLVGVSALGLGIAVWGVVTFGVWPTVFGATLSIVAKLWFVDRMVWLYQDMTPGAGNIGKTAGPGMSTPGGA